MREIGDPLTAAESAALIAAARQCVTDRVRFKHTGRDPRIGLDCSGLLVWCLRTIGRPVADRTDYGRDPHMDGLRLAVEANLGPPVPLSSLTAGDVLLMAFEGEPRHVALTAPYPYGGLMLVHAYGAKRRVVEHRLNDEWMDRIVAVYRP